MIRKVTLALPVGLAVWAGLALAAEPGPAAPLSELLANPVNSMRKVLRDEPVPECFGTLSALRWEKSAPFEPLEMARMKTARVALARNEFEGVQIVLKALNGGVTGVRLEIGELRDRKTGTVFPSSDIATWQVGFVEMFSLWNANLNLGWWPDPLLPLAPGVAMTIPAGQNQPVLLRFHTRDNTAAGVYRGAITIHANGQADLQLPLEVTVWDFSVPVEQHFTMAIPVWGDHMEKMWPGTQTPERRRAYLDLLYDYRVAPFPLEPGAETAHAFDRGMREFCLTCYPKDGVPPDMREKLTELIRQWRLYPWAGQATPYVLLGDEPSKEQWPIIREQGRIVREIAPEIRRMNTVSLYGKVPGDETLFAESDVIGKYAQYYTETYETMKSAVNVFILGAGYGYPVEEATRLGQERNFGLWWYYVADPTYIAMPGAYTRITLWKHWKYQVPGLLHWGMSYWGDVNIAGRDGKKWPDIPWHTRGAGANVPETAAGSRGGDGALVYPAPGGVAFWPSQRLEQFRDGIEDYEYFWLLADLNQKLEKTGAKTKVTAAQLAENRRLLAIEPGVVNSFTDFTQDASVLLAARARLAQAIVNTQRLLKE